MATNQEPDEAEQAKFSQWIAEQTAIFRATVPPDIRAQAGQAEYIRSAKSAIDARKTPAGLRTYAYSGAGRSERTYRAL